MSDTQKANLATPVAIVIAGIFIAGAVFLSNSSINPLRGSNGVNGTPSAGLGQVQGTGNTKFTVSIDDDPIKGDPNAPMTIVEFSDYECPFCQKAFRETYPIIIQEYINTGKARFVFRDYPLTDLHPNAMSYALAANCVREQGSDETYYNFHDQLFTKAATGPVSADGLGAIASGLGLDQNQFSSCLTSQKYLDEVTKDMQDGNDLSQQTVDSMGRGIGTPTFVIGKTTDNGTIEGEIIVGAQGISAFKAVLDKAN